MIAEHELVKARKKDTGRNIGVIGFERFKVEMLFAVEGEMFDRQFGEARFDLRLCEFEKVGDIAERGGSDMGQISTKLLSLASCAVIGT